MRKLRALPDPPNIAMLTTFDVDEYVSEALRLGANGFLLKDTEPEQLVRAVRDLADGGAVLDPGMAARVLAAVAGVERVAEPARRLLSALSQRECEVLTLIGQGMSNAQIGGALHLSEATVKGYVSSVLGKIGAVNRVQAAPVKLCRRHLRVSRGRVGAILVNAGNANCATRTGDRVALASCHSVAKHLKLPPAP